MTSIRQVLQAAQKRIDRFDAQLLLGFCLSKNRIYLITHETDELDSTTLEHFETLVSRREAGEPFAYIVGVQEFFSRAFKVTPDVLIPRPDTETLIETTLEEIKRYPAETLLDMGTGSGCIAITLALEAKHLKVYASDICPRALAIAQENAQALHASITLYEGAWYTAISENQRFDVIVSNPPYIESNDEHLKSLTYEPISALTDGDNGLTDLEKIITGAPAHLNAYGLLVLEHGWNQGAAVRNLFDADIWRDVRTVKDLGGNDRITLARLR